MKINITIIAGGFGTRLWPASRASLPKQFLSFDEQYSLFQSTINRVSDLDIDSITTVCNENHRFFVAEQLENINKNQELFKLCFS